jgi:hypothetical protein
MAGFQLFTEVSRNVECCVDTSVVNMLRGQLRFRID